MYHDIAATATGPQRTATATTIGSRALPNPSELLRSRTESRSYDNVLRQKYTAVRSSSMLSRGLPLLLPRWQRDEWPLLSSHESRQCRRLLHDRSAPRPRHSSAPPSMPEGVALNSVASTVFNLKQQQRSRRAAAVASSHADAAEAAHHRAAVQLACTLSS